jgi:hypothetical protein
MSHTACAAPTYRVTVAHRVLVCSLQLSMHVVAVTAVPVGLLVTQCQLLHRVRCCGARDNVDVHAYSAHT